MDKDIDNFATPKRHKKQAPRFNTVLIASVGAIVIVAFVSFIGGMDYQKSHIGSSSSSNASSKLGINGASRSTRRRGVFGTVSSVSSASIAIHNVRTDATETYAITGSTKVMDNGSTASVSDIQVGETVLIQVSTSGSTTAAQITVNPDMSGFGGNGSSTDSQVTAPPAGTSIE